MSKSLKLLVDFTCYEGSSVNEATDAIRLKRLLEESSLTEAARIQDSVSTGTTNQTINIASSCNYLIISTDQTITVVLNGSDTPLTLSPKTAGTKSVALVWRGTINSLTVSNASGSTANIDVISVG